MVWPEPGSSAAGTRMVQLVDLFLANGYQVTFASAASKSEFSYDFSHTTVAEQEFKLNDESFNTVLKALNPDIVLFDRFMIEEQFGWRVSNVLPKAIKILDTEDLHCLRKARQEATKKNTLFEILDFNSDIAKREIAAIFRCDLSLMVSDYEMHLLETVFQVPKSILFYLPIWIEKFALEKQDFHTKIDFVFIGNFLHEPNWNTVQYLKEAIWPSIKKDFPEAVLEVYGAYPSQKALQLHNTKKGFLIKGRAESVTEVYSKSRIF